MRRIAGLGEMEKNREGIAVEYAGFWMRLGAHLIDGIILGIIGWIIGYIIRLVGYGVLTGKEEIGFALSTAEGGAEFPILLSLIGCVIGVVYCVAFWTWRGQTPGKIALGIKIIRTDGSPIDLGRSILRYIGYIISSFILMIGYLWIAFDPRKQGIHDKIAGTYVIRLPRKRAILPEIYG